MFEFNETTGKILDRALIVSRPERLFWQTSFSNRDFNGLRRKEITRDDKRNEFSRDQRYDKAQNEKISTNDLINKICNEFILQRRKSVGSPTYLNIRTQMTA